VRKLTAREHVAGWLAVAGVALLVGSVILGLWLPVLLVSGACLFASVWVGDGQIDMQGLGHAVVAGGIAWLIAAALLRL
jgi:HAMP domain-containing protein